MNETMKVFLACALGAFIGTVVALEVNHYFWWLGLIAGGFTGYISYEFKMVAMAIPTAWRKARGWQPDHEWWREHVPHALAFGGFVTTLATPFNLILMTLPLSNLAYKTALLVNPFLLGTCMAALFFQDESIERLTSFRRDFRAVTNPFRFYFWLLPKWTLKGGWWLLRNAPTFIVYLFREIHSDIRMLCGLDAAIGTIIGYFAGSAVIGGLAGGLWGALNFEILSIRVLKLIPIEHSLLRRL